MASGRGGKKGIEAGRAYVKAWFDDSLVTRGLKGMRASITSVSESLQNVGTKLLGGGVAIGSLFLKPIADAGRMQAVFASFETIFKGSTDAMGVWADTLAKSLGRSRTDVREFMTQTQGRLLAAGMNPAQAEGISKQLATRAFDLAQFWDKDDQTAFLAMQNALTGEMEMLKQFGIVIHDADTKAKLRAMGLDPKTASQAQKANARFLLMLERSAEVEGTAAREAGEFTSLIKRLWAEIKTLSETVGNFLLPVALPMMQMFADGIGRVTEFAKANGRLIVATAATAAALTIFGSGAIAAAIAIRTTTMVVGALALAIRGVLLPATIAITAASKIAAGTFAAASLAVRGLAATVKAASATMFGLAAVSSVVGHVLGAVTIAMNLAKSTAVGWAVATRIAAAATTAFTWTTRIAAAGVAFLGLTIKAVALTLGALSTAFAIFGNPVGATVLAIAALAAGIYAAMQNGVTFGGVIGWLTERFAPLARQALAVFKVISNALMAGEWGAAARVMWAAIQLAFAHGLKWMRGHWLTLKEFALSTFIDLSAELRSLWAKVSSEIKDGLSGFLGGVASAAETAFGVMRRLVSEAWEAQKAIYALAEIGADTLVTNEAGPKVDAEIDKIEQERRAAQEKLRQQIAAERAANDKSADDEFQSLKQEMKDARIATAAAEGRIKAGAELPEAPSADDLKAELDKLLKDAEGKVKKPELLSRSSVDAVNTAAVVGTVSGGDALAKALTGSRDQTTAAVIAGNRQLEAIRRQLERQKQVVVSEGRLS